MNKDPAPQQSTKPIKRPFFKHDPLTSVIVIAVIFVISQLIALYIVSVYPSLKNWPSDQGTTWLQTSILGQFSYILVAEVCAIWLVFWLLKIKHIAKASIGFKRPRLGDAGYALVGYGIYFIAYIAIITVASHFTNLNVDQPQQIGFDAAIGKQLYLVFIALVILPPLAEEIMFRGFLFTSLRQKFRLRYAVVLTSLLFGVAHLQFGSGAPLLWVAALDTFTLSCVLCNLREKTGSLWASIGLHALKNGVAFIALFHTKF